MLLTTLTVAFDGQHVVKRFFTPVLALLSGLMPAQFVSRRSILPTGNFATLY
ncbi:ATP-dependent RNA helicase, RhlE1 domain protein [Mycobacterium ulcerans str. Harvey]|uniref:ATP-dependent RNA helicase, RhlE1 domain protein n=1 Tax=Mycobacterium ulcerans str. Harvey TaxID=1299332 RepID=A0ABN0R6K8_MYCUL|nr:ATP-dependent RNA helicase, RhlE1 domain protein [Mycobacterium ulcerans str. Harvey]